MTRLRDDATAQQAGIVFTPAEVAVLQEALAVRIQYLNALWCGERRLDHSTSAQHFQRQLTEALSARRKLCGGVTP